MAVEIGAGDRLALTHVDLKCRRRADRQRLLQKQARIPCGARRLEQHEHGQPLRRRRDEVKRVVLLERVVADANRARA